MIGSSGSRMSSRSRASQASLTCGCGYASFDRHFVTSPRTPGRQTSALRAPAGKPACSGCQRRVVFQWQVAHDRRGASHCGQHRGNHCDGFLDSGSLTRSRNAGPVASPVAAEASRNATRPGSTNPRTATSRRSTGARTARIWATNSPGPVFRLGRGCKRGSSSAAALRISANPARTAVAARHNVGGGAVVGC